MDSTKCTFGIRMPIDLHMLNEIIYREVKHFRNYKTYRPNFGVTPVAGKFYAAHDQLKTQSPEELRKVEDYFNNVTKSRAKGPRSKYPSPVTDNQTYGWYSIPLLPMDRNDGRFYRPQRESRETKTEIMIKMANPGKRH
ncbi:unnamed protein product, partial [Iphiclides podalirius]